MLLLAQTGSVKIGEVVRYTVTYTPSRDRILPTPERLYVRIRNTSNIALRAAFVHGPYTLCVSAYPASYNPNEKFNNPRRYGVPSFEPMVKAGGSWECELAVPDDVRQSAATDISRGGMSMAGTDGTGTSASTSWVIEVSSQVIFSSSAAVGYELLMARDEKSLNLSSTTPIVGGQAKVPQPGKLSDHQQHQQHRRHHQAHGVFSRAVDLKVEDTAALWNSPPLPEWDRTEGGVDKQKKVHLVILTHGLHSNLCADMLYMKESIDAAARQAKTDARRRKARERAERGQQKGGRDVDITEPAPETAQARDKPIESHDHDDDNNNEVDEHDEHDDGSEDEEVIVRGYSGNATKTEKGIKYLGKRLARYVLSMTYPDQPFLPLGKGAIEGFKHGLGRHGHEFMQTHKNSTANTAEDADAKSMSQPKRPYRITSISFIGHSLGGLVQTYAIAYIQKHSPSFFDVIRPINFIALASPFLGLSNENPLYVKFALDFGLVGRTGQDLGLTWRAPTIARSGWGAIVSNLGESAHKKVYGESQPESKPLLRILPTGPAHTALKKFRNRTVYSSVVNDGIVPLRTSCLLFLDWQGLGRVGKARRDAGLVETMVGFGWAELTGANMVSSRQKLQMPRADEAQTDSGMNTPVDESYQVPQPSSDAMAEDDRASLRSFPAAFADEGLPSPPGNGEGSIQTPLSGFFNLFRSSEPPKEQPASEKQKMILRRSQTLKTDETSTTLVSTTPSETTTTTTTTTMTAMTSRTASSTPTSTGRATSGQELENDPNGVVMVPPRTTFFESAGDLLNPKIPDVEYLLDPSKRPRTIFHDRVYHPTDIPPPPIKKRTSTLSRMKLKAPSSSSQTSLAGSGTCPPSPSPAGAPSERSGLSSPHRDYDEGSEVVDGTSMRVEEKIARGYHRELSWRKVLVKLEPDAHNNIVVRRMFPNAYGWPVMKHLVEAHFSDSAVARMRDEDEHVGERALDMSQPPDEHGGETRTVSSSQMRQAEAAETMTGVDVNMEACEALDEVPDLPRMRGGDDASQQRRQQQQQQLPGLERPDSMSWSEHDWVDSENESEAEGGGDGSGRLSPGWNWTEKIVGKGATRGRSQSPATSK